MLPPNSIAVRGKLYRLDAEDTVIWSVPEEMPVALLLNSEPLAVMMATPADLEDFARGFVLAEGLIHSQAHIQNILLLPSAEGFALDLAIAPEHLQMEHLVSRNLEGRTGCGLCGIADIQKAIRLPPDKLKAVILSPQAVALAYHHLPALQPMSQVNRTVHGAAWCSATGDVLLVREDVGRHNALDKLIGALALREIDRSTGFVFMTSRCSFELVQKCALAGIAALATISAPTALALRLAQQAGVKLAALSREGVMMFEQEA